MPDITLTKEQVEELAAKLDQLGEDLDDNERALLLSIFALAKEAIGERTDDDVQGFVFGSISHSGAGLQLRGYQASSSRFALSDGFKAAFVGGGIRPGGVESGDVMVQGGVNVVGTG